MSHIPVKIQISTFSFLFFFFFFLETERVNGAFENARKCALQKDETCVYDTFARFVINNNNNNKTQTSALLKCRKTMFFSCCVNSLVFFSLFFPLGEIPPLF
jgi:hypothetical protein